MPSLVVSFLLLSSSLLFPIPIRNFWIFFSLFSSLLFDFSALSTLFHTHTHTHTNNNTLKHTHIASSTAATDLFTSTHYWHFGLIFFFQLKIQNCVLMSWPLKAVNLFQFGFFRRCDVLCVDRSSVLRVSFVVEVIFISNFLCVSRAQLKLLIRSSLNKCCILISFLSAKNDVESKLSRILKY